MFLELRSVTKRFGGVAAVDHVDLDIEAGEFICFLGPSGCGKTTLLRLIAGLESLDEGAILLRGSDLGQLPARKRNFGVVFQSYSLFPGMTVARNVAYGLACRKWPRREIEARVDEMLDLVHLRDQAGKYPHELSGGMQQRVALARALAPEPAVLLLDEPLSALDAKVRETLRSEIRDLQKRLGITTIMVTHDQDEAMEMADRILVMNRGRIEQVGVAQDLYRRPATRFVGEFIGRLNVLERERWGDLLPPAGDLSEALLAIRPEHVRLLAADEAPAGPVVEGRVRKVAFLGNMTRLLVEADAGLVEIEVHGPLQQGEVGETLRFVLPGEHLSAVSAGPR
ncbi:iron(III) transport system ATP-binding protein [Tistlia consotensis]|uniref:Iron(III) transport system ATP-binding protein n=1 Tax=Tistlia consotensis USBA 355 TaxID=560819 RepID=A0A1Y6C3E6_9PROT|nr:ATP-binding cassette domain-containing protein [Tistlia consotensis]SMF41112.1 iron(III) transport system ATP-binding protein [Tistlia consotensis USBA 355]SNR74046.1 iron(III) transport system ATP-binding protein [Tistlia consotensis]